MRLGKKLAAWREAGLVTADQAAAIAAFEEKRGGSPGVWIVGALGALGGLAVVAGIISLIAANWSSIPAAVKLLSLGALVAASLLAARQLSSEGRTLASDLFLFAHGLLALAMVALVGQIYHLGGGPWRAFALCAALAVPPAVIGQRSLLSDLPIAYSLVALALFIAKSPAMREELRGFGLGLLAAGIGGTLLLSGQLLSRAHAAASVALRRWGAALVAAACIGAAFIWSLRAPETPGHMAVFAAGVGLAIVALLAWTRRVAALLGTVLALAFLLGAAIWTGERGDVPRRFTGFLLFCAAASSFAVAAAQSGRRWLTNLLTLAVAARIVVLFVELIRSLAMTGVGLVLTGAVFCGVAWAWWRLHGLIAPSREGP